MALLRYTLNDGASKVDVQASWYEELYYGPIKVENGYVRTNDDVAIFVLCNRGFEIVKEDAQQVKGTPDEPVDEPVDEPESDVKADDDAEVEETDDAPVEDAHEPVEAELPTATELHKMPRKQLNDMAENLGIAEDADKAYDTKRDVVDAILAAREEEVE